MANTLLTPNIVAKEALMVLESNLTMAPLVHTDYSDEFAQVGDTITIRKPAEFIAKNFTGTTSVQDITEGSATVKMDRFRDITANVTSKQMSLDIEDFSEQIIKPAMRSIAQAIDTDLLTVGVEKAGTKISATSNPTNLADIAALAKTLDLKKVPMSERRLILRPEHKYAYALTDNLSKVSYAGDSETLRRYEIGNVYNFDTFMSQNAPYCAATTSGSATSYKVTAAAGATSVSLSDLNTTSATIKSGDTFIIDGYMYRFTEDKTGASSAISSINIDQPIHKTFTNEEATPIKLPHSLAFHKNGIALVHRPLALPMDGSRSAYERNSDGLSVRVVFDYNSTTKTDTVSFDILYGITALNSDMIVSLA